MRQKAQSSSMIERLNNAMAQLHSQKLTFEVERNNLLSELSRVREENQKLRMKIKELKRANRQNELQGNRQGAQRDGQSEQIIMKIQQYSTRVQESSKQMALIASQCSEFGNDIEKAASQIEKNIIKSLGGLQKYVQELVRQWCIKSTLKLENERLQRQNKYLVELTSKLQQNFKETDRIIKHLQRGQSKEDKYALQIKGRIARLQEENNEKDSHVHQELVNDLENKISKLSEKVKSLEQENSTIKNIHQRTMKKLEKLEQQNSQKEQGNLINGQGLQQQRNRWLEKTEEMYDQIRRLNRQLLLSQQSEKKVKDQLASCLEIYSQWELQKQQRRREIEGLRKGIEAYLIKIEELQLSLSDKKGEIEALCERLQSSQAQKQQIVSVYQQEVQQMNSQLLIKQDAVTQLEAIISKEHTKMQELKKKYAQLDNAFHNLEEDHKQTLEEVVKHQSIVKSKDDEIFQWKDKLTMRQNEFNQLRLSSSKERQSLKMSIERQKEEKEQIISIMTQFKDEYHTAKKQMTKLQEEIQSFHDQAFSIKQELRNVLNVNDSILDVWALIASIRQQIKGLTAQNKNLKISQITLIQESQGKDYEYQEQIVQMTSKYNNLRQKIEGQKRNDQIQLKMYKMKAFQLRPQGDTEKAKTMKELIEILLNNTKDKSHKHKLEKDLDLLNQEIKIRNAEIEKMKAQILHQNEIYEQLQRENEALDKQITSLNNIQLPQSSNIDASITNKNQEIIARQEELKISLDKIHEKEIALDQERLSLNEKLAEKQNIIQEQQAALNSYSTVIEQKQQTIKLLKSTLQSKEKDIQSVSQIKQEKESLLLQLEEVKEKCEKLSNQVMNSKLQNQQYAQRLEQIEEIMEILKKEEEECELLRMKLQQSQAEKQKLEETISAMGKTYQVSANNFMVFEKRNKELSQQIQQYTKQLQTSKQELNKSHQEIEKLKNLILQDKLKLGQYQKLGNREEIRKIIQNYRHDKKQLQEMRNNQNQFDKTMSILKSIANQLEKSLIKKDEELSLKDKQRVAMDAQMKKLKEAIKIKDNKIEQNDQLTKRIQRLKQDLQQCKEQLLQKDVKISQMKKSNSKFQVEKQLLQEQVREKQRDYELLQKQIEHYKLEIKKISKEKALAKSEAIKNKCSSQEQQSLFKLKESEIQEEFRKSFSEKEEIIRQLKQEINHLRESNDSLREQSCIEINNRVSQRSSEVFSRQFKGQDFPLQFSRNRQKSTQNI